MSMIEQEAPKRARVISNPNHSMYGVEGWVLRAIETPYGSRLYEFVPDIDMMFTGSVSAVWFKEYDLAFFE